jgi:hypothetical protein
MDFTDPMFWATLSAAIATLIAALVALFLRELRAWFRPPKLKMSLSRENGLAVTAHLYPPGQALPVSYRAEKSRYYHLKVSNPRREVDSVNGVAVTLQRLERRGQDGDYYEEWSGDIPIIWRNELPGGERKVIGTWAECDLCSVVKDKWLELHVKLQPNDLKVRYLVGQDMPVDFVLTVQARGNEVDSEVQRWRIVWDGRWEDGGVEMRKHLSVTRFSDREPR